VKPVIPTLLEMIGSSYYDYGDNIVVTKCYRQQAISKAINSSDIQTIDVDNVVLMTAAR